MSTNKPMADDRLAEARVALDEDMLQWQREYSADLLAEVKRLRVDNERLRALTTVDEAMVERAARESYGPQMWDRFMAAGHGVAQVQLSAHCAMTRAALNAALGTGEGS